MLRAYQDTTHKKPENIKHPWLFIDITHDTNPYKNIINQTTRIKI